MKSIQEKVQNKKKEMNKYLQKMSTDTDFTDVTFKVKGEEFKGNKIIFAQRCSFFEKLFKSNCLPFDLVIDHRLAKGTNEYDTNIVEINDMEPPVFKGIVHSE